MAADMSARDVCTALGGRWHGRYGLAFCPAHDNRRTPALTIADGDDGRLLVHCFRGCSGRDILAALRSRGLSAGGGDSRPNLEAAARHKDEDAAQDRRRIELARRCWHEAGPIRGTLAERYLRSRGITCDLPPTLRFHAACWHGPTARHIPAMIAAVTSGRRITGVHRTFLAEPGIKAFGPSSKLMLGCCAGGAVRLSGGHAPLAVAEGIETALSLLDALADRSPRVWAGLSTSGVAGLNLPPDPGELVLAPDGDPAGIKAAMTLADRAAGAGWHVRMMECEPRRDWNDVLQECQA